MESQSQNPEFRINPENFHPLASVVQQKTEETLYEPAYETGSY